MRKITILPEADVILNKVLVLTPFNKEKMTDFLPGNSHNRLREEA
jgi:hypothetical protein